MPVTKLYADILLDTAKELARTAKVEIDGVEKEFPIAHRIVEGGKIKNIIYLVNETGLIGKGSIYDAVGRELQYKDFLITKGPDGIALVFAVDIEIKEGEI